MQAGVWAREAPTRESLEEGEDRASNFLQNHHRWLGGMKAVDLHLRPLWENRLGNGPAIEPTAKNLGVEACECERAAYLCPPLRTRSGLTQESRARSLLRRRPLRRFIDIREEETNGKARRREATHETQAIRQPRSIFDIERCSHEHHDGEFDPGSG